MSVIHFGCTACGKCCRRPPRIYMDELLRQAETFPWFATVGITQLADLKDSEMMERLSEDLDIDPQENPDDFAKSIQLFNNQKISRSFISKDVPKTPLAVFLTFNAAEDVRYGELAPCSKRLPDGKCSIYSSRPDGCEAAPIPEFLVGTYRENRIRDFVESHDNACDTSDAAPVLLKDGKIVDENVKEAWINGTKGVPGFEPSLVRRVTRDTIEYYCKFTGSSRKSFMRSLVRIGPSRSVHFDLTFVIHPMLKRELITLEEAIALLEAQARVLRKYAGTLSFGEPSPLEYGLSPDRRDIFVIIADLYEDYGKKLSKISAEIEEDDQNAA